MDEDKELSGLTEGDKVWSPIYGESLVSGANPDNLVVDASDTRGRVIPWGVDFDGHRTGLRDPHPTFYLNKKSFMKYWQMTENKEKSNV